MTTSAPAQDPGAFTISLASRCRRAGMEVPLSATLAYCEALDALGPRGLGDLYWAGRATLVRRHEDIDRYDDAFAEMLAGTLGAPPQAAAPCRPVVRDEAGDGDDLPATSDALSYSATEVLRHTDFADLDDDALERMLEGVEIRRSVRRSRRRRPDPRGTGPIDLGRTTRAALRTHGETFQRIATSRRMRVRPLVLLLDVSGSMEPYARALLRVAHLLRAGGPKVEVFSLGTRLTRLTRALDHRDPSSALSAAGAEIADWAGGTRLGASLHTFNDRWGVPGAARGAVVVVLSDGWDRGDPDLLAREMGRLARVAHRIVWVNPLKATEGYEPLAAGMAAALPHVDRFVAGNSVAALEELLDAIAT